VGIVTPLHSHYSE